MSKILLLGSSGFIGKAVGKALCDAARPHTAYGTSSKGPLKLDRSVGVVEDILIESAPDIVILCAGRTGGVGRMLNDPFSFVYPNVRIHMNVFEACVNVGVKRVVCVQSTTGYADSPIRMREEAYNVGDLHPAYRIPGNAHRFINNLAESLKDLEVVFFRPSNVYGPGNSFDAQNSHVIEATVRKVVERQNPFVIWGTGEEIRDAIYIDDLAEAILKGIDAPPGAYNVAAGEEMSVNDIVDVLCVHEEFTPLFQYDASKPTAIPVRRVDITKAKKLLGWTPKVGMREGLIRTLKWYKANR